MILADLACHYPHFCAKCARIPQAERPRPRGQAHGHTLAREDARGAAKGANFFKLAIPSVYLT
jgi:hypothetical protein